MSDENLLDRVEEIEMVLPIPIHEFEQRLDAQTSLNPTAIGTSRFVGRVGGGTFWARLRNWRKRGLRPNIEGTYEAFGAGTKIKAKVAMPWWARPLGRFTFVASILMGLGLGVTAFTGGLADVPTVMWYAMAAAPVWMTGIGVASAGFMVADGAAEREEAAEAFRALFERQGAADMQRASGRETEGALERAKKRRAATRKDKA